MAVDIKIGLDPEFMMKFKGEYIYPKLGLAGNPKLNSLPKNSPEADALRDVSYDEFGHCVEIRPKEASTAKQVVLNTISAMAKLPDCFNYYSENSHILDKKILIAIMRKIGNKDMSHSINIYGGDILDDCPADIAARKDGKRLLFCGGHMHVSATDTIITRVDGVNHSKKVNIPLPVQTLVRLFDKYLFTPLVKDNHFDIGRYRQRGFYELKTMHGGFEYRSLGSSMLTPRRVLLVSEIMIELTKFCLNPNTIDVAMFGARNITSFVPKHILQLSEELGKTDEVKSNLRKLWVQF